MLSRQRAGLAHAVLMHSISGAIGDAYWALVTTVCLRMLGYTDLESEGETWFSEHKGTLLSNAADLRYGKANVTPLAQAAGGHDLLAHGSSNGEIEPFWEA